MGAPAQHGPWARDGAGARGDDIVVTGPCAREIRRGDSVSDRRGRGEPAAGGFNGDSSLVAWFLGIGQVP